MKPYLLDTNIISYFINNYQWALVERVAQAMASQTAAISVITQAELRYGQADAGQAIQGHQDFELVTWLVIK